LDTTVLKGGMVGVFFCTAFSSIRGRRGIVGVWECEIPVYCRVKKERKEFLICKNNTKVYIHTGCTSGFPLSLNVLV